MKKLPTLAVLAASPFSACTNPGHPNRNSARHETKGVKRKLLGSLVLMGILGGPADGFAMVDPATPAGATPSNGETGWALDFSDEFNGTSLDTTKWHKDVSTTTRGPRPERGISDWWWRSENVNMDGVGNLVLSTVKHDWNTMYCGSISSDGLYEPKYGYLEARIKIADNTKDTHTAFWIQGHNQGNVDGTGNDGAEVDFFESAWFADITSCPVHIDGYGASHQSFGPSYDVPGIHSGYRTFGVEWNEHVMNIYYDGKLKAQHQGTWVPQVPEFLWLSTGGNFGDIGTFQSEPNGWLTDAKVDYVRVWKQAVAQIMHVVGGAKMNGDFNATTGASCSFNRTGGWSNVAPGGDQGAVATKSDVTYDGSQNAVIAAGTDREFGMNTGYEMIEGDVFDIRFVWKDDYNWVDATDQIRVTLYVTSDNTLTGTRKNLVSVLSGISSVNGTYETFSAEDVYTATAFDAHKVLFVAIDGNDSASGGFARLDNFELIRISAPKSAQTIVGGSTLNGYFNSPSTAGSKSFSSVENWVALNGNQTLSFLLDTEANAHDGHYAQVSEQYAADPALDTGHTLSEGDVFDVSFLWRDGWNWSDASDQVLLTLYVTENNLATGTQTVLATVNSGTSTLNGLYEWVDQNAIHTAGAAHVGKKLFVGLKTLNGNGAADGYAQIDNLSLEVTPAIVSGTTLNGNFNNPGTSGTISFATEGNWVALSGSQSGTFLNNAAANVYDGHYAQLSEQYASNPALDTGHTISYGDVFDVSFLWRDGWDWSDASDRVLLTLYVTDNNLTTGTQTVLATVNSGASTLNGTYELVDQKAVYTAAAAHVGKKLFVGLKTQNGNGQATGYAQLDNLKITLQ